MAKSSAENSRLVLHVVVVGFHHKKGCQVEYAYPPLISGNPVDSHDLPDEWRHLPSLALPDGAHNYNYDTIYFHLPSRDGNQKTVYGVSCYRQMDAKDLLNKTEDVTRCTVQKSVCVLSTLPLFGLIHAKLELITHAYFQERDFSKVELLQQTYQNLSATLSESMLTGSQIFLGISARDAVMLFKHRIVVLFKLILLERRVLFTGSPVQKLCNGLLEVLSLFPGMIEHGLDESASYCPLKQLSPTLKLTSLSSGSEDFLEVHYKGDEKSKADELDDKFLFERSPSVDSERSIDTSLCNNVNSDSNMRTSTNISHFVQVRELKSEISKSESLKRYTASCSMEDKSQTVLHNSCEDNNQLDCVENNTNTRLAKLNIDHMSSTEDRYEMVQMSPDIIDPLSDMSRITHIEAVQLGETVQSDISQFKENATGHDNLSPGRGNISNIRLSVSPELASIAIPNAEDLACFADGYEPIDSPESISKIDKEDCFSWEEDKLLLKFTHEEELNEESDPLNESNNSSIDKNVNINEKNTSVDSDEFDGFPLGSDIEQPQLQAMDREIMDDVLLLEHSDEEGVIRIMRRTNETDSKIQTDRMVLPKDDKLPKNIDDADSGKSASQIRSKLMTAFGGFGKRKHKDSLGFVISGKACSSEIPADEQNATELPQDGFGFPLTIFSKGSLCHPYLCLQYYELLHDVNVRSFVIGATNILFTQKRHLTDVVVDVNTGKIDIHDGDLRRQLNLTTADLRFADIIVKAVTSETTSGDHYLNATEWEGGDEWLRGQFRVYLQALLVSTLQEDERIMDDFGLSFMYAWRMTHNYSTWRGSEHPDIHLQEPGHPCSGQLSVGDLKMKLTSAIQNTERGKKLNTAVSSTGKYVVQTGKVVGGALNQAKSAFSSWFSSLTQANQNPDT